MKWNHEQYITVGTVFFLCIWMLTSTEEIIADATFVDENKYGAFTVLIERFYATEVSHEIVIHGEIAPNREAILTSEVDGKVLKLHKREGEFVNAGQLIIEIDAQDKPQKLIMAKTLLKQRELELRANETLVSQGLQNKIRLTESEYQFEKAKAQLKLLTVQLAATQVRAPFSGILEDRKVELGAYLKNGDAIIRLLDYNPYVIKGYVSENDLPKFSVGSLAQGRTLDQKIVDGHIRYVSSQANSASRTFLVELEVANTKERQNSGATAEILLSIDQSAAVFFSPALLSLDANGILGVKHASNDQQVVFTQVNIIKAESSGVWVSGLPDPVDLIVVGQGFVGEGEKIQLVYRTPVIDRDEIINQTLASHEKRSLL